MLIIFYNYFYFNIKMSTVITTSNNTPNSNQILCFRL